MTQAAASTPTAASPATGGLLLLAGVVVATLTESVASTVLALGRFEIIGDIHATSDEFAWMDMAYVGLKLIGFVVTAWLLSRWSPRRVLLAATLAIGAACGLAALISRLDVLVLLRAIQGFAGAALLVSGQVLIFRAYPWSRQPLLQALFAMGAVVAPATLAPALQGWLIDSADWTWIFASVAPVALVAVGLILLADNVVIPVTDPCPLDWMACALTVLLILCLTYVLSQGSRWDWFQNRRIVALTGLGVVAAALLAARLKHIATAGLFDGSVFRSDAFAFAFAISFVAGAALLGSGYLIPTFAVSVLGFTPTDAGLLLLPSSGLFALSLLLAATLIQSRGLPPIATAPVGILLVMTAMAMLSGTTSESGPADMTAAILVRGFGLGCLFLSITLIAFGELAPQTLAYGIGLFNIGRMVGGLIGVAGLQTLLDHQIVANQAVLGANLTPGLPALSERMTATAADLAARGLDPGAASKAAIAALGRSVGVQATTIAFDLAFVAMALLFVVAAPLLVTFKIGLGRAAKQRAIRLPGAA